MKVADLQIHSKINRSELNRPDNQIHQKQSLDESKKALSVPFGEILEKTMAANHEIYFSAHAIRRIEERQLGLSPEIVSRLNNGVQKVEEKGAKNSLILVDDTAYIVSVKNKTVVTAIGKNEEDRNVFTNVDSVAIV